MRTKNQADGPGPGKMGALWGLKAWRATEESLGSLAKAAYTLKTARLADRPAISQTQNAQTHDAQMHDAVRRSRQHRIKGPLGMDGFTIGDLIILLILCSSALWGFFRGLAREAMDVFTWAAAAAGAVYFKDQVMPYVARWVGDPIAAQILSFLVLFVLLLILISLVTTPLMKIFRFKSLKAINRLLGLVYGLARGFLICAVLWMAYIMAQQPKTIDAIIGSRLGPTIHQSAWIVHGLAASVARQAQLDRNGNINELLDTAASFLSDVDTVYKQGRLPGSPGLSTPNLPAPAPSAPSSAPSFSTPSPKPRPTTPLLSAQLQPMTASPDTPHPHTPHPRTSHTRMTQGFNSSAATAGTRYA